VRALQCDRCEGWDKWKCVECLGITADVYDALYDCKDIFWFCQGCNGEAVKVADQKEDRVLTILEKTMEKLCGMEDKLHEKADRRSVEDLDSRVGKLEAYVADSECKVNELVDRVKQVDDRMIAVGDKCVQVQHRAVSGRDDDVDRDEEREIERRRNNMILYQKLILKSQKTGRLGTCWLFMNCVERSSMWKLIVEILKECIGWENGRLIKYDLSWLSLAAMI